MVADASVNACRCRCNERCPYAGRGVLLSSKSLVYPPCGIINRKIVLSTMGLKTFEINKSFNYIGYRTDSS
jgi:hypothetical protein